jgi:hypothetical protein
MSRRYSSLAASFGCCALAGVLSTVACSDDNGGSPNPSAGGSSNAGSSNAGSSNAGTNNAGTNSSGGSGGSGGTSSATCGTETWINGSDAHVPFAEGVYTFADMEGSTAGLKAVDGKVCLCGDTVANTEAIDYGGWGAGMGIKVATGENPEVPWDAAALGISKVQFDLEIVTAPAGGVRPQLTSDSGDFLLLAGTSPRTISTSVSNELTPFSDYANYDWGTNMPTTVELATDALKALQFMAVSTGTPGSYNFCVSNVKWLNDSDEEVTPTDGSGGSGGTGGTGQGGEGGAP